MGRFAISLLARWASILTLGFVRRLAFPPDPSKGHRRRHPRFPAPGGKNRRFGEAIGRERFGNTHTVQYIHAWSLVLLGGSSFFLRRDPNHRQAGSASIFLPYGDAFALRRGFSWKKVFARSVGIVEEIRQCRDRTTIHCCGKARGEIFIYLRPTANLLGTRAPVRNTQHTFAELRQDSPV